ncbi:MAG: hypothetical protein J0J01_30580 [Reyranella sp.]|uniref:YciI family protein n=1 Tax=Reyranella sp. TaxID=1929291 RepID=UPI001AC694F3|nr:YciI family protein [Reyranella sp.]MBN9091285.1 hypothetical protein [Reyranella sp.]
MAAYLLILHRDRNRPALSPAEMAEIVRRYAEWGDALRARGKLISSEKLAPGGHCIRRQEGALLVTDGPYAETRDVIGGYYVFEAEDEAEALAIAKSSPHLWSTNWIELRAVDRDAVAEARARVEEMSIPAGAERR